MANWKLAATAIGGLIEQAEGVGKVYVGEEDVNTLARIAELAEAPQTEEDIVAEQKKINLWQIGRTGVTSSAKDLPPQQSWRVHQLVIRGYYGEGEGAWEEFQDLIDAVMSSLEGISGVKNPDPASSDLWEITQPDASPIGRAALGPYGCHSVEMRMVVLEQRKHSHRRAI